MWKIVIIDDDPQVLTGMKRAIPWGELNAVCVGEGLDGKKGLDVIRNERPDIVLTDIYMPVMSGLEMLEQLRNEDYQGKLIILSGYSDFEYARQALRLQVDDYLSKPVTISTIKTVIQNAIRQLEQEAVQRVFQEEIKQRLKMYEPFYDNDLAKSGNENIKHKKMVEFVIQYIQEHYAKDITICEIAEKLYISKNYLNQIFKKATGESFNHYLTLVRLEKAKAMILEGNYLVYEIAEKVGYKNTPYFSTLFKKYMGMNPTDFIR
ncbi:response regulator [Fodinisporobacter ferrooxydans]|uniref:Response regulator n=1 Tax=Fodinisporobacter ferrooxydans TaxID=2901836 RepID=A0ABY4CG44_9BACL|nr:response regulator [Alicyclobacillaceae bacterium MYW30-H2]